MYLLKWMGMAFARFVGVSVALLGGWIFILNLGDRGWESWVLVWVLASGLLGALSGLAFLLSFDGPDRFRNRTARLIAWLGMLASVSLPTSLTFMLVPMILLVLPTLFLTPSPAGANREPITSE